MTDPAELTESIKHLAREHGFARVGIAPAGPACGADAFKAWLASGRHGQMAYLARNVEKRFNPSLLVDGASSVICLAVSYAPGPGGGEDRAGPFVARYARGRDYHQVLKARCRRLIDSIRRIAPDFTGRGFVDSAPLAERSLAAAAGLGWIGRNGCLIIPDLGSYVVLAEIVSNLKLLPDRPAEAACGDCYACIHACPTGACGGDSLIDATRCLSYLTIEHRGRIDRQYWPLMGRRVFGCDGCQDVCPHNRDVPAGDQELTTPAQGSDLPGAAIAEAPLAEMLQWRQADWLSATAGAATGRTGYESFIRNIIISAGCSGRAELADSVAGLRPAWPQFQQIIDWASQRLCRSAGAD